MQVRKSNAGRLFPPCLHDGAARRLPRNSAPSLSPRRARCYCGRAAKLDARRRHGGPRGRSDMILAVEDLSKKFVGVEALRPLSFAIERGITAIIGPNGAGKTTLFNLLSGIDEPTSGRIRHRGEDITAL